MDGGVRFLSPAQAAALLDAPKFTVSPENLGYQSLGLDAAYADRQDRVEARQPSDLAGLTYFVSTINQWLPANRERLLWISHWEGATLDAMPAEAIWRGLGERRPILDAPGLLLPAHDWAEQDQLIISGEHREAASVLAGVVALVMMSQSNGWLIAPGCADRLEFWEGNILFYSESRDHLARARAIIAEFGCVLWE